MNKLIIGITGCLISALWCGQAAAWGSANRYGGSTEHVAGEGTEHTNAFGGSSEHAYGGGSEHTNTYGGSTAGRYGEGAEHTNVYGGTTAGKYGEGAVHTDPYGASAYHPPVPAPAPTTIRPLHTIRTIRRSRCRTTPRPDARGARRRRGPSSVWQRARR